MVFTFIFFLHLVACCILKVKSQTFDLTFFQQMSNMHVNQVVSILLAGWLAGYFFVCKKYCPFLFFFSSLSVSLVVYFGAGSRSFVRHFFFCHHQIGPAESYTSKVEWWIMEELHKWNCISSIFPRV